MTEGMTARGALQRGGKGAFRLTERGAADAGVLNRLDRLALRCGRVGRSLRADYRFEFNILGSTAAVPSGVFGRMARAGLIDAAGAVTEAGRAAARGLIGGPQP